MKINIEVNGKLLVFNEPTYTHLTKLEASATVSKESYDILKSLCDTQQLLGQLPITSYVEVIDKLRDAIFDEDCLIQATCPNKHPQEVIYKYIPKEEFFIKPITLGEGDNALTINVPSIEVYFSRLEMCKSQTMKIHGIDDNIAKIISVIEETTPIMSLSKLNSLSSKDSMKAKNLIDKIVNKIYEIELVDYTCPVCGDKYQLPIHMSSEFWLPVVK